MIRSCATSICAVLNLLAVVVSAWFLATPATLAQCDGRWLTSLEQQSPGMNNSVRALAVLPNGDLVAGGDFTMAGGVNASRIARWSGSFWSPLGTGVGGGTGDPVVSALAVLTNGDLVAGGDFTQPAGCP